MTKKREILIVDDDQISATTLAKRLERRDFVVRMVNNPLHAVDEVKTHSPELVLLDIVMPELDGISVLKELRKLHDSQSLPIIMVTALDDSFDLVEAFKEGANDFITKPVNIDVVAARAKAHLSVSDLQRENLRKGELETVTAMVATYNHEINNPLAIAIGGLEALERKSPDVDQKSLNMVRNSLNKIVEITRKIEELSNAQDVDYDQYEGEHKMVKIK